MKMKKHDDGSVNVYGSIKTLEVGERMRFKRADVTQERVRNSATRISMDRGWKISVSAVLTDPKYIYVTRIS